jgi:site-specific recombinase XerD
MFTDALTIANFDVLRNEVPVSIHDLMVQYLYYAKNVRGLADSTLKSRIIYLGQFYRYAEERELKLDRITNSDLDFYFVQMSQRKSIHTGRQITTGTVNTSKRAIKAFLTWCDAYMEIPLKVRLGEIRESKRDDTYPKILTHKQITTVIKQTRNKQDKLIISVIYEAGLRIAELADMRIEHLRGTTLDVVGKGRKHRITYLSPLLAKAIRSWMIQNGWSEGHVFRPQQHGGERYIHTDTIRQRIKRLFWEKLGIEMHPHLLRHAFALRLLKNGCGLRSIQKLLGHAKIETTMMYLQICDEYLRLEYSQSFKQSVYA